MSALDTGMVLKEASRARSPCRPGQGTAQPLPSACWRQRGAGEGSFAAPTVAATRRNSDTAAAALRPWQWRERVLVRCWAAVLDPRRAHPTNRDASRELLRRRRWRPAIAVAPFGAGAIAESARHDWRDRCCCVDTVGRLRVDALGAQPRSKSGHSSVGRGRSCCTAQPAHDSERKGTGDRRHRPSALLEAPRRWGTACVVGPTFTLIVATTRLRPTAPAPVVPPCRAALRANSRRCHR